MSTKPVAFHPYVCQYEHCVNGFTSVKKCTDCKTMPYCCKEHQSLDWKTHKPLCKAIKLSNELIPYNVNTLLDFKIYKTAIRIGWETNLKRSLTFYESSVYLYIPACSICFTKENLSACPNCKCVSYCSEAHAKNHQQEHDKYCNLLKLSFQIHIEKFELPFFPNRLYLADFNYPSDINDLLNKTQLETPGLIRYINGHLLSPCGTIIYALHSCRTIIKSQFTFYVIGAGLEEQKYNWITFGNLILTFFPSIKRVKFIFIGPELELVKEIKFKNIELQYYKNFYHDIVEDLVNKPNLLVIFNGGLHEENEDGLNTWEPSLHKFFDNPGIPLVITGYLKEEVEEDRKLLYKACPSLKTIVEVRKNPFASPNPFRNWELTIPIYFSNNYVYMCMK